MVLSGVIQSTEDLGRDDESKVLLLDELRSKIDQLNPLLESDSHKIDQVIYELNSILINVPPRIGAQ